MDDKKGAFRFIASLIVLISQFGETFDIRDAFVCIGSILLFYGLYLLAPWLAFTAIGLLLITFGVIMRGK